MEWLSGLATRIVTGLQDSAWAADWLQAMGAFIALPLTWLVAVWTTQAGIRATYERDFLDRHSQRHRADAVVTECRKHLLTQILLCAGRLKDAAVLLYDPPRANVEVVFTILGSAEHYRERIKRLNAHELHLGAGAPMIDAVIDDVVWLLNRMQIEIVAVLNSSSYGQLRKVYNGRTPYFWIGEFTEHNADALLVVLGNAVGYLGDDGEDWVTENRLLLEIALRAIKPPPVPPPLVEIKATGQSPGRPVIMPQAPPPYHPAG